MPVYKIQSSLLECIISTLRDKNTGHRSFLRNVKRVAVLLAAEAVKDLETRQKSIETPIKITEGKEIKNPIILVSILRAGLSMSDSVYDLIPDSKVGHIGVYRDEENEEKNVIQYLNKLPFDTNSADVIICDPMIGTGNTLIHCIDLIKKEYCPKSIRVLSVISYKNSLDKLEKNYTDVKFFVACIDDEITSSKYISPGLGDAGDRAFGTKK